jgi:hypothetical protein
MLLPAARPTDLPGCAFAPVGRGIRRPVCFHQMPTATLVRKESKGAAAQIDLSCRPFVARVHYTERRGRVEKKALPSHALLCRVLPMMPANRVWPAVAPLAAYGQPLPFVARSPGQSGAAHCPALLDQPATSPGTRCGAFPGVVLALQPLAAGPCHAARQAWRTLVAALPTDLALVADVPLD